MKNLHLPHKMSVGAAQEENASFLRAVHPPAAGYHRKKLHAVLASAKQLRTGALKARLNLAQGKRSAALGYRPSKAASPVGAAQEENASFLRAVHPPAVGYHRKKLHAVLASAKQLRTGALKARLNLAQGKRSAALGYRPSRASSPVRAAQEENASFLRGASPRATRQSRNVDAASCRVMKRLEASST